MNGGAHEPRNGSFAELQQLHVAGLLKRNTSPLCVDVAASRSDPPPGEKPERFFALMKYVVNYIADRPANAGFHRLI
jgi:hypothetical protein